MSNRFHCAAAIALFLAIPAASWADFSGTATVPAGSALNLDTGAVSTTGGDVLFNGTTLTAQGSAKAFDSGNQMLGGFNLDDLGVLEAFLPVMTNDPVTAKVGDVLAVLTGGGYYSKVLVTAIGAASVTLQYLTYGVSAPAAAPAIATVQNNYSYLLPGMPNYGIAPSSIFIVTGTDLANPGTAVLQSSAAPGIPTTLNGASISVTVNGTTVHPGMYYAIPTAIAAVLPASTPVGTGTITVTYNGTPSSAEPIVVVPTALGLDTYYGTGTGLAAVTDAITGALFTPAQSASPGQIITLWGSGLGADAADSDTVFTSPPHAVNVPLQIYIGGVQATIGYQGGSGYPGLNQINVTIPQSVQPGCGVSIVAISGSIVSNAVAIPINPGGGACSDPLLDVPGQPAETGNTYQNGTVIIDQAAGSGQTVDSAGATFDKVTGNLQEAAAALTSVGNCRVAESVSGVVTGVTNTGLDAGNITVMGPGGASQALTAAASLPGAYDSVLPAGFVPAAGGTFTFTGSGGKDVGPFTATVTYSNPMTWTNQSSLASIDRSQPATVTWTGGDTPGYVLITGTSTSPQNSNGANGPVSAGFNCLAPVAPGQFTVPPYIMLGLPAGTGALSVENATTPVPFSASGIDFGYGFAAFYTSLQVTWQ